VSWRRSLPTDCEQLPERRIQRVDARELRARRDVHSLLRNITLTPLTVAPSRPIRRQAGSEAPVLVVQDNGQEGAIDLDVAVVFDESEVAELVHEEVDAGAGRADHLGERFLRQLRQQELLVLLAVARQQEQDTREPLFARVEEMIDEVFLNPDVPRQHVREEPIGKRRLRVQHLEHLGLLDDEHHARAQRQGGRHAPRLPREAPLAKEVTRPQDRHDRFFAQPRLHRELDAPLLQVEHVGGGIPLREDDGRPGVFGDSSGDAA